MPERETRLTAEEAIAHLKLRERERLFVLEYLICHNGAEAVRRAQYKCKKPQAYGTELLLKPHIKEALAIARAALAEATKITPERVLEEQAKIAFANMSDYITIGDDGLAYIDLSALTADQAAAIQEVTVDEYTEGRGEDARDVKKVRIKLSDKRAALVDIGKHLGMYEEKHTVTLDLGQVGDAIAAALGYEVTDGSE